MDFVATKGFAYFFLIATALFIFLVLRRTIKWGGRVINLSLALLFIYAYACTALGVYAATKDGEQVVIAALLNAVPEYLRNWFPDWPTELLIGPSIDSLGVYDDSYSNSFLASFLGSGSLPAFLFEGGKVLLLSFILEVTQGVQKLIHKSRHFLTWLLEECLVVSVGVVVNEYVLYFMEKTFSPIAFQLIFIMGFPLLSIAVVSFGLLGLFGHIAIPLLSQADSFYYELLLKPVVAALVSTDLAYIADQTGLMKRFYGFFEDFLRATPTELGMHAFLLLAFLIVWYVVYKAFEL